MQLVDSRVTINKLVEITNRQTQIVKKDIEMLLLRKARMSSGQYDNFIRRHIEEYCGEIIAIEPINVGINNLQINKVDLDDWSNDPTIVAVIVVKAAPLIASTSKFAKKIIMKGSMKSVLFGVKNKVVGTYQGLPLTVKGGLYMPGSLILGAGGGIVKAATTRDKDLSLKAILRDFEFKGKAGD